MAASSHFTMQQIAAGVLDSLGNKSSTHPELSDEDILLLHATFGSVFERACEIIETPNAITVYLLKNSLRTAAEIKGRSDKTYKLIPKINYCSCPAFQFQVLKSGSEITCKHVLALSVAQMLGKCIEQSVTQIQYDTITNSIYAIDIPHG